MTDTSRTLYCRPTGVVFDDDHAAFRDSVGTFLDRDVVPHYDGWRNAGSIPDEIYYAAGEYGFLGVNVSEAFGGAGVADPRFGLVLIEECMARGATGLALTLALHVGVCAPHLERYGSAAAKERWLPDLANGRVRAAVADGSQLQSGMAESITTTLVGGPGTARAGILLVWCVDRVLLVDPSEPAATTRTDANDFIGLREAPGCTVDLVDARPVSDASGTAALVASVDAWIAVLHACGARAALDLAISYVGERRVFGQPLGRMENTRTVLGEVASRTQAACELAYRAALSDGGEDTTRAMSAASRLTAAGIHRDAADVALQLHGGYGYMREYPVSNAFADAAVLTAMPGVGTRAEHVVAAALGL